MPDLRLSLAINDYVHTAGYHQRPRSRTGHRSDHRQFALRGGRHALRRQPEFDVAEYSLSNYCAHLAEPRPSPMVALPVFTSRVFRHSSIYVNEASNIADAGDLAGRTIGIPQWSQTATVYVRGYLTHDAGVQLASIRWVQAGVDQPGRRDSVPSLLSGGRHGDPVPRPDAERSLGIRRDRRRDLGPPAAMFCAGRARRPPPFSGFSEGGGALFRKDRDISHYARDRHRTSPCTRRNRSIARIFSRRFRSGEAGGPRVARYPDLASPVGVGQTRSERVHKLLFPDGDRWPYGLKPNPPTLKAFLAYAHEQGVTRRRLGARTSFRKKCCSTSGLTLPCALRGRARCE